MIRRHLLTVLLALAGGAACSSRTYLDRKRERAEPTARAPMASSSVSVVNAADAPAEPAPPSPDPSFEELADVLYAGHANGASLGSACPPAIPSEARARCLFDERYRGDGAAAKLANELYARWRVVAGTEVAHRMDGGYRGMITIEPALPTGPDRKHIEWVTVAFRDFETFFDELSRHRGSAPAPGATRARYRYRPLTLRFLRSVGARTPSAYASEWTIGWNVVGSLNISPDATRETMFHEVFHLNDAAHGSPSSEWSITALGTIFEGIVRRCGTKISCLAPYTPNETIVRGGTYYSFQPGNGVREYAAELALRYYREQRAALRSLPKVKPFKCGPPENQRAWALIRDEFFDGVDAVPACPS